MQLKAKVVRISVRSSHFNVAVYCIQEHSMSASHFINGVSPPRPLAFEVYL